MDVDYSPFANFLPLQQRHTTLKRPLLPYYQYNNNITLPHSAYGLIFKILLTFAHLPWQRELLMAVMINYWVTLTIPFCTVSLKNCISIYRLSGKYISWCRFSVVALLNLSDTTGARDSPIAAREIQTSHVSGHNTIDFYNCLLLCFKYSCSKSLFIHILLFFFLSSWRLQV